LKALSSFHTTKTGRLPLHNEEKVLKLLPTCRRQRGFWKT